MSEPTLPEQGAAERLHPLFLLTGLGGALRGLAGGYAVIGYLAVSGRLETALIGAVALLAMMAAGTVLYWTRFEFRVGEHEIRIDSGILNRTHRSIPFERIQDVDITQGPVARLLGLAQVKFETGSAAVGPNAAEGVLHAIPLERAENIRALIRERRPAPAAAAEADAPPIYAMTAGRLVLAGTFNFSLALFAGLFGLTQTLGDAVGFDPLNARFWTGLLSADSPVAQYVLQHRVAAAIAGALLLVAVGLLTGIVRTVLRDYGFRLDRSDAGLRRRRGLLTRTDVTLPRSRAQAMILATGPLRERFGWSEVKLQSLARDEGGGGDHVVAPLATGCEAGAVLSELGWRPLAGAPGWTRVSKAYVGTLALGLSPLILLAVLQAAAFALGVAILEGSSAIRPLAALLGGFIFGMILLAAALVALLVRWLAWRRSGYALDGDRLLLRSGWWRRRIAILPLDRIQSIDLAENFVGRRFGIATLRFGVAGGSGFSAHSIPAIPRDTARNLRKELLGSAS